MAKIKVSGGEIIKGKLHLSFCDSEVKEIEVVYYNKNRSDYEEVFGDDVLTEKLNNFQILLNENEKFMIDGLLMCAMKEVRRGSAGYTKLVDEICNNKFDEMFTIDNLKAYDEYIESTNYSKGYVGYNGDVVSYVKEHFPSFDYINLIGYFEIEYLSIDEFCYYFSPIAKNYDDDVYDYYWSDSSIQINTDLTIEFC